MCVGGLPLYEIVDAPFIRSISAKLCIVYVRYGLYDMTLQYIIKYTSV